MISQNKRKRYIVVFSSIMRFTVFTIPSADITVNTRNGKVYHNFQLLLPLLSVTMNCFFRMAIDSASTPGSKNGNRQIGWSVEPI